jgi:hypothetical protein
MLSRTVLSIASINNTFSNIIIENKDLKVEAKQEGDSLVIEVKPAGKTLR